MREIMAASVARKSSTVLPLYATAVGLKRPVLDQGGPGSRTGRSLRRDASMVIWASCANRSSRIAIYYFDCSANSRRVGLAAALGGFENSRAPSSSEVHFML